jgi:molecular chaperone DnaK
MEADAEKNKGEDENRRKVVNAKNELDGLSYSVEKTLKENEAKVDAAAKTEVEAALKEAKEALEGTDANRMKAATEALQKASNKVAEQLYKQTAADGAANGNGANGNGHTHGADGEKTQETKGGKDDVIDADFKEL